MFCRFVFIHTLLKNQVFINNAPQIDGNDITITEQKDIDDPSTLDIIMKNNIKRIFYKGNDISSILTISVFPMITYVDIDAPNVYNIPIQSFENCVCLETVKLSSGIKKIDYAAFKNTGLKSINLENVEVIGY
ncbi:hypothetical protein TVAG_366160 [Trichomonas vaginalis G3]|uniref:Surface antigen BspA-like n=1 Tax=Trichomonas vaginalis (strain ATCC PRA-98 / G3) TaxID=412133 RepID=A2DHR0_TRIV3|nr:ribonuclease inhibitor domain-containing protein [Trichomonas vaginalis G3]EAY20108.1 hypothetical protein TVAG_366160 [Trichomonas vaginalis G3]KAI5528061.1 ribonuclease inhibitor domain-containing protein [Trichomonas vaginalis G3]|eukprot:XP_001581094.1 hypothetical protein [Trichomonas vaginalis G3]